MDEFITKELKKYASILESHFRDMVDMEFTIEKGIIYVLSARIGKRTAIANLKIIIEMFLEGKIDINDVILKLPYSQIEDLVNKYFLINSEDLFPLAKGLPASPGIGIGTVCFSQMEALNLIRKKEKFIYCKYECNPEDIDIMVSLYCQGVITLRGGMTSHAAVVCRGMKLVCVIGTSVDYEEFKKNALLNNNEVTIDGDNGIIYGGTGKVQKSDSLPEIKVLYELLKMVIKCNIVNIKTAPNVWRLWDIIVLDRRYEKENSGKRMIDKVNMQYRSFKQPTQNEINRIHKNLYSLENGELIIRGFIEFMVSALSTQVSLGNHYLYMRPLLDPAKSIRFVEGKHRGYSYDLAGYQLTGIEFFNINQFIDYFIDITSLKMYFETEFNYYDDLTVNEKEQNKYFPLNYLDHTNPKGESLVINTYKAIKAIVYVNGAVVSLEKLALFYHLARRRMYHWHWYEENNVTKNEIVQYLTSEAYLLKERTRMYYLCEEMNLIKGTYLTPVGMSLVKGQYYE